MSHSGLKSLDDVAQAICLPNERAPVRLPTYPSIDKTALFRYRYQNTQSLREAAPASEFNVLGRKRFLVTRDPAAPLLLDTVHYLQQDIGANTLYYEGSILVRAESFNIVSIEPNHEVNPLLRTSTVTFEKMYPIEKYATLPCGEYDSQQWFLIPKTLNSQGKSMGFLDSIGVGLFLDGEYRGGRVQSFRPGADLVPPLYDVGRTVLDYTVTLEIMASDGTRTSLVCDHDFSYSVHGTANPIVNTGLVSFSLDNAMVRIKSITYNGQVMLVAPNDTLNPYPSPVSVHPVIVLSRNKATPGYGNPLPFRCLSLPPAKVNPEYYNSVAPFRSTRLNASALLLTNVTKVLNKEGTVESSRLLIDPSSGGTLHNADVVTVSASNPETRYFGALEKGAYTFTAPDQESLVFTTPYESLHVNESQDYDPHNVEKTVERPVLNLCARYVNCIITTDLDATDDTQLALTLDTHWEFRTISTLYTLDYSRMPIEVYHAAMLACMRAGFFYENNTHQRILSAVGKGLKFAAPLVPGGNLLQLAHSAAQAVADHRAKKKKPPAAPQHGKAKGKGNMSQKGLK